MERTVQDLMRKLMKQLMNINGEKKKQLMNIHGEKNVRLPWLPTEDAIFCRSNGGDMRDSFPKKFHCFLCAAKVEIKSVIFITFSAFS